MPYNWDTHAVPVGQSIFDGIDPPEKHAPTYRPYTVTTAAEIAQLAVADVLADDSFVFLWTINKFITDAIGMLEEWGCRFAFVMVWHKSDGAQFPMCPRFNAEYVIVGRHGKPQWQEVSDFRIANCWPRGAHSEKPEGFYDLLRRVTPGPRLDVFGRRRIAGFDSWGNEAPEGLALPDHYQTVMT